MILEVIFDICYRLNNCMLGYISALKKNDFLGTYPLIFAHINKELSVSVLDAECLYLNMVRLKSF